jgi:hypothetical protein
MLTASSIKVLLRFLQKRTWDNLKKKRGKKSPTNYHSDWLTFTYGEALALGIKGSSFYRAICELIKYGFLEITHQGGGLGVGLDFNEYKLIEDYRQYGTPHFVPRDKPLAGPKSSGFTAHNIKKAQRGQSSMTSAASQN